MRLDGHRYAVRTDCSAINPSDLVFDARVVNQIPGREIVRSIQYEVAVFHQSFNIRMVDVGDFRFNLDLAIYLADMVCGGDCFGYAFRGIALRKHCLALKICRFYKVAIRNSQFTDPGPRKALGMSRTQGPTTDDQDTRMQ